MTSGDFPFLAVHRLAAGTRFFHVHPWHVDGVTREIRYPADAFNPAAPYRFAGLLADPRRAMWYGGSTLDCALWETVLRDLGVIGPGGRVIVPPGWAAGKRLSIVRTTCDLSVVELMPDALRRMGAGASVRDAWMALTQTADHASTHAPAAALLAAADVKGLDINGLTWFSRQTGGRREHPLALALYRPPCPLTDLFEPDPAIAAIDLDSTLGQRVIDSVLRKAGFHRVEDPGDEGSTEDAE
ncbi:MAG: RES domain-containing protein [Dokdonella sp.]